MLIDNAWQMVLQNEEFLLYEYREVGRSNCTVLGEGICLVIGFGEVSLCSFDATNYSPAKSDKSDFPYHVQYVDSFE